MLPRTVLAIFATVVCPTLVLAHPVPRDNHDRTIVVHLTPGAVLIDYRLEVDEIRALRDLDEADVSLAAVRSRKDVHDIYLRHMAPAIRGNLVVRLDGRELAVEPREQGSALLDHVRCDYRFKAPWKLEPAATHRFEFYEGNFAIDSVSAIRLTLTSSPELSTKDELVPGDGFQLSDRSRRTIRTMVQAAPSVVTAVVKPALPPDLEPVRPGARGRARQWVSSSKPVPDVVMGSVRTSGPEQSPPASQGGLLELLFDTELGLGVLLLLAAAFGAVHALTPGHGKTMVAAYLVGERGTMWHAVVLGLVTTLTHTAAVLIIAAVLPLCFPDAVPATVQAALGLVGGLLIAGLGLWLLLQRLAGQADHVHIIGGHRHGGEEQARQPTWWALIVLGVSGGIVPCWDAIAMLGLAISTQRLWLGFPLLLAFSAGLAGVLVALGISVVRAREMMQSRLDDPERYRRLIRALPVVSALVITVLGLWLCFESARIGV